MSYPTGLAVDSAGDLFIADGNQRRVREVLANGTMITVAGNGIQGFTGNGGPATAAELNGPADVAVDASGDLFIADNGNISDNIGTDQIREVIPGATITVNRATPHVTVSDPSGTYNGSAFAATDTVAGVVSGVDTTPAASLESVTPSLTYYSGTGATGTALSGAPTSVGTYTVLASFAGSADYTSASASTTFTISPALQPPSSSVTALPLRTSLTSFTVSWSGTAGGGGPIASYDISVSIDGGAFSSLAHEHHSHVGHLQRHDRPHLRLHQPGRRHGGRRRACAYHRRHDHHDDVDPWQNPVNPLDVNGDGVISPIDALLVINYLNSHPAETVLPPTYSAGSAYLDVLGTGSVIPTDALQIINYLNLNSLSTQPVTGSPALKVVLEAQDPSSGVELTQVSPGQSFNLVAYVQDTRSTPFGVFSAYTDVSYNSNLATISPSANLTYGNDFSERPSGSTATAGSILDAGGFDQITAFPANRNPAEDPGGSYELWSVPAIVPPNAAAGTLTFTPSSSNGDNPYFYTNLYDSTNPEPLADVDSVAATLTVTGRPTTISVAASATTVTYAQTVNLTATVASTTTPSEGTVTFYDGSTTLGTGPVSGGTATLNSVLLPVGIDVITATYTDSLGNFSGSSTTVGPNSIIQTVAGNGTAGYGGDGGQATQAAMDFVPDIAVDAAGIFSSPTHSIIGFARSTLSPT